MTFSKLSDKNNKINDRLRDNLEKIGVREIYLWKEIVRKDNALFEQIYRLIYCDNPKIAWHAAWVIDHVSEKEPAKLRPYVSELISQLPNLKSSSLKRHFTRMLLRQVIPENQLGKLIDDLYYLLSPNEAIAVRANALQLLYDIVVAEPGLKPELILVVETILEEELTPGMKSKGRNILKALEAQ